MGDEIGLLGMRRELAGEAPLWLSGTGGREPLSFYWARPSAQLRVAGFGETARRELPRTPAQDVPAQDINEESAAGAPDGGLGALVDSLVRPGVIEWLDRTGPRPPGPWFGAAAFDDKGPMGPSWRGFGSGRFLLPRLLCWSEAGRHFAAAFAVDDGGERAAIRRGLEARLEHLTVAREGAGPVDPSATSNPGRKRPAAVQQQPAHARADWDKLVESALAAIARGELHKLVAARAIEVRTAGALDPRPVLLALERRHPTCRIFCLRGDDGAWFLGATPELLCTVDGREVETEALAGTARASEAERLLRSAKDLREHRWVVEHLVAGLSALCESVSAPAAPRVRELADVVHLLTPLRGRLREGTGPGDVISALHPTPAVAGVPSESALRFLAREEGLRRGLYAGPVGLVGEGRAELAVALRCAVLRGERARLFVGAGLVSGSSPEAEWRETELKSAAVLAALGAGAAIAPPRAGAHEERAERPAPAAEPGARAAGDRR
jgi:isochorismate synthase